MNKYFVIVLLLFSSTLIFCQTEEVEVEAVEESIDHSRTYNKVSIASTKRPDKKLKDHFEEAFREYNSGRNVRVGKGLRLHPPVPTIYKEGEMSGLKLTKETLTPAEYQTINYIRAERWVAQKDGKFGALDYGGQVAIPFVYASLLHFADGQVSDYKDKVRHYDRTEKDNILKLVIARYLAKDPSTQKYGIIDGYNRIVLPFEYDEVLINYGYKYLTVTKNGKKGIMDFKMNILVPIEFDDAKKSPSPLFWAVTNNEKMGLYKDGKIVMPLEYRFIMPYILTCQEDQEMPTFYIVSKGDNVGLLDSKQSIILPFEYQNMMPFLPVRGTEISKRECRYYFSAIKDTEWRVFNQEGKEILNTGKRDMKNFIPLSNGEVLFLSFVSNEGIIIDAEGKSRTFNNYQLISTGYKFNELKKELEQKHQGKKMVVLLYDKSNRKYTHYILDDGSILEME